MGKHQTSFLRLYQPRDGYLYNSDSLLLIDFARIFLAPHTLPSTHPLYKAQKSKMINLVDIGAGCGIIGLLCAKHFGVRSHLIEINKYMATLAYINARTNGDCLLERNQFKHLTQDFRQNLSNEFEAKFETTFETKTPFEDSFDTFAKSQNLTFCLKNATKPPLARVYNMDFLDFSLLEILSQNISQSQNIKLKQKQFNQNTSKIHTQNLANNTNVVNSVKNATNSTKNATKKADFCISNPPFYPDGALRSSNPHLVESRYATSMPLEQWIPQARRILAQRGGLIFCYHPSELSRVFSVLKDSRFTPEVLRLVYPLQEREATLALIFARLDSRATLRVLPPLFTHISNGTNYARQDNFTPEVAKIYATYRTHSIKIHTSDMEWLDL